MLLNLINEVDETVDAQEVEVGETKQGYLIDYVRKKDRCYYKDEDSTMNGSTMASRLGF